ncbi:tetratricopeptide repeat protein [Streptomyces sp. ISL-22]|uniref:tetratricopeptide repeat protein n=1 Tax=unclassified Streptomyces TaxID=2593676 RepID=UPI001BE68C50|nr:MULTISPECIES: tetratricopeptide repeat protein [unclassified Streptomyces]MBT2423548.1 tetratricopeptide repeat protein [Streptomyces sp. ISL-24]MBT2431019.1 tetratricopeptide repeat protein [Streptomyces sp. ISL-22]
MAPRTNDSEPEKGEPSADERIAAVRRVSAARGQERRGELSTPGGLLQPVRRSRTRPVQGRSGGLRATGPQDGGVERAQLLEDGTGRGGGGEKPSDQRIAAVRRVAAAGRRRRALHLAGCAALLAVALTAGSIALGAVRDTGPQHLTPASAAVSPGLLASGDLDAGITSLQAHLRAQPKDFSSWSALGLAYVEQARTKGDPSRYPQAEQAFERSLELAGDNDQALAGHAALAAARHDFEDALRYADQALKVNPYSERALCTRIDALVELGRYADAAKAADTADDRRPGIPVFTRYAYVRELRGDVPTARRVLEQALSSAVTPGDIAYVATQLGQLAWNQGDHERALTHYARALAADENYVPALEGRARAQAASGDRAGAVKGLEDVVSRYPLPGPLVALGELYEAAGDRAEAADQYALVDAWTALARAGGVNADLDTALAAADHGDKASALRAARAEWDRRHTVHTADALAWALHVNGKDEEALPYARRATATGYRNAAFLYHRGIIERATGHAEDAREHLEAALKLNPGFSPLGAREARTALKDLEAAK